LGPIFNNLVIQRESTFKLNI